MADKAISTRLQTIYRHEQEALKAVNSGTASSYQQQVCLALIVKKLSQDHFLQYVPGMPDESAFLSGRSFVGIQIIKILNQPAEKFPVVPHPGEPGDNVFINETVEIAN